MGAEGVVTGCSRCDLVDAVLRCNGGGLFAGQFHVKSFGLAYGKRIILTPSAGTPHFAVR